MNPAAIVAWVGLVIGAIGIAATIWVYLRQSVDKVTIDSLQRSVIAMETELKLKDRKIESQDDEIGRLKGQITGMGRQIHTLQGVVTQAAEVARLQETLDRHHAEAMEHWQKVEERLTNG